MAKRAKKLDPVTQYATDVVTGKIVAGRRVCQACARHLKDLETGAGRGLVWNPDEAQQAIDFFPTILCLPEESDGDAADEVETADAGNVEDGIPFQLTAWQQFVVGSLFGWWTARGRLRFRTCYLETGKGSGKTPLCAGCLIYMAIRFGGQFYVAAVTREQAGIGFADCEKMVAASPYLRNVFKKTVNNLSIAATSTFIRAISSEKRALDGKRVSGAMVDELHEQRTAVVPNKIRKGIKGRPNAIIFEPTNAGFDRTSVCWNHREYSCKVLEGIVQGDDWFAFVCALDPCDEHLKAGREFPDEKCPHCDDWKIEGPHWLKPNPNLGVSIPWDYLRPLVKQAIGMPSEVNDLLRFNFGIWTQHVHRAFDIAAWQACSDIDISAIDLSKYPCYGALDLGQTDDLAAWSRVWDVHDCDLFVVKMRFWLPAAAKVKFPNRPYDQWERLEVDGHPMLEFTDGKTTDEATIEAAVLEDVRADGITEVAFDKRFANRIAQNLMAEDVMMVDTPQGFWLNESIRVLQKKAVDHKLAHGGNALLAYQADVAVVRSGRNGEVRLDKEQSKDKIDGLVALAMGISRIIVDPPDDYDSDPELVTA